MWPTSHFTFVLCKLHLHFITSTFNQVPVNTYVNLKLIKEFWSFHIFDIFPWKHWLKNVYVYVFYWYQITSVTQVAMLLIQMCYKYFVIMNNTFRICIKCDICKGFLCNGTFISLIFPWVSNNTFLCSIHHL